jgi:hypothetical protein
MKQKKPIVRRAIMNTQRTSEYMLLFRGTDWHKGLSPEEIQQVVTQWKAWFDRLTEQGKAKAGHPLEYSGKIVSGKKGRVVADGPFAESKEAIGGYFFLQVDSLDEAVAIAQDCPGLEYGAIVEVRPIAEVCPTALKAPQALAEEELAQASA